MVCLNEVISFKKLNLRNNLTNELNDELQRNFYLSDFPQLKLESDIKSELTIKIIDNIKKIIKNKMNDLFSNDNFIFINMDDNICTHKFKKGKNDGRFCCKKITKYGDKNNYVCTRHNKNHIPKKKNKNLKNSKNSNHCKIFENNKNIDNSIMKSDNKKIKKRKMKLKNKKIKINVYGEINFNNIIKRLSQEILA